MGGGRLEAFVGSLGLETEDVPKVVGTFVCCKYATWGVGIALGVRYQPLRRVLLSRNSMIVLKAQPWAQRQRLRFKEIIDSARRVDTSSTAKASSQSSSSSSIARAGNLAKRAASTAAKAGSRSGHRQSQRGFGAGFTEAMYRASAFSTFWRNRAYDVSTRARASGLRKLLRFQKMVQQQRQMRRKQLAELRSSPAPSEWYAWISKKYWKIADKIEVTARTSTIGRFFSSTFGLKPQGLALGFAEGTILFKATSPVVLPLQLWFLVNFFKRQRLQTFLATAPAACEECEEESSNSVRQESL